MNQPLPVAKEGKEVHWLLFDGDVDAEWVENMNSVMDDNRLLTLPNGERIQLQDFCKLIIGAWLCCLISFLNCFWTRIKKKKKK